MTTVLKLPDDWNETPVGRPLIDEGVHHVAVEQAEQMNAAQVRVVFRVLDQGPFSGRLLFETFQISTRTGLAMFKELVTVLDIPQDGQVDLGEIKTRTLRVLVRHREDSETGLRYANVAQHIADSK